MLAWRLNFSDRGEFLVMQSMDVPERKWTIMVWDLSTQSAKDIQNLVERGGALLKTYACRIASFDRSGPPAFTEAELVAWDPEFYAPCRESLATE
jgi:hypothetical protein